MNTLRISLFGGFRIAQDGWQSETKITHTTQALLAYLLLHRHQYQRRELLVDLFWPDYSPDRARSCLNTALWRLRRVLEPESVPRGTYLVTTSSDEVGFNQKSDYWMDVAIFEDRVRPTLLPASKSLEISEVQELENTLQLYKGDLLEGFYDDWVLRERERLRSLYLGCLDRLMHYYKDSGDYSKSLNCAQRILECDPLREEIHREVMQLYFATGQRARAIQQYEACRNVLDLLHKYAKMETCDTTTSKAETRRTSND